MRAGQGLLLFPVLSADGPHAPEATVKWKVKSEMGTMGFLMAPIVPGSPGEAEAVLPENTPTV